MGLFKKVRKLVKKTGISAVAKTVTHAVKKITGANTDTLKTKLQSAMDKAKAEAAADAAALAKNDPANVGADINPLAMPNADDPELRKARRRSAIEAQLRGGRQATMITDKSGY